MDIKITAGNFFSIPKEMKTKWNKKLSKVRNDSDKIAIILMGKILEILSGKEAVFICEGKFDYDMFGRCDFFLEFICRKI